jgi:hypothetical protein
MRGARRQATAVRAGAMSRTADILAWIGRRKGRLKPNNMRRRLVFGILKSNYND